MTTELYWRTLEEESFNKFLQLPVNDPEERWGPISLLSKHGKFSQKLQLQKNL